VGSVNRSSRRDIGIIHNFMKSISNVSQSILKLGKSLGELFGQHESFTITYEPSSKLKKRVLYLDGGELSTKYATPRKKQSKT